MIKVSEAVQNEFLSPAQKNLRLKFSDGSTLYNADIYSETMNFEQAICTEEQIRFGAVNSACFKIQIKGTAKRYKGLKVTPYIYTKSGGVTLGEFTISSDELSDNREYRTLTAYDALNDVFEKDLSSWYTNLRLPMTLKQFRNSLFSTLGITQETTTLPNDDMTVERTVSTTDAVLSGKKVLESICEINGCFGAMVYASNKSVFRYVTIKKDDSLYPRNDLYPNNELYPHQGDVLLTDENDILQGGLVYQEYTSLPIKRLQLRNNVNDVGITYPNISTGNGYQITDNFLLYGKDATQLETIAKNLFEEIEHISYIPTKATMRGRPWQELGDLVIVSIKRTSVTFPVLHRVLSGITALKDEFEAKGRENYTFNINTTKRQFEQLRQKTLEIVTTVDELRTTMTERVTELDGRVESYKSEFQQTAQQIQTTVEAHYNEQTAFKSQITQRADSIESRVTATENGLTTAQSTITQTANEIKAEITSKTSHASIVAAINDNTSSVKINADKIDLNGFVTFTDLSTSGKTTINGDNIKTGTINADLITTGKLQASMVVTAWNNYSDMTYLDSSGLWIKDASGNPIVNFGSNGVAPYYSGSKVGYIHGTKWESETSKRGLALDLDYGQSFLAIGAKSSTDSPYYVKLLYTGVNPPSDYGADMLHLGCDLDARRNKIKNMVVDKVYTSDGGTGYSGDAKVMFDTNRSATLRIKDGIVIAWTGDVTSNYS